MWRRALIASFQEFQAERPINEAREALRTAEGLCSVKVELPGHARVPSFAALDLLPGPRLDARVRFAPACLWSLRYCRTRPTWLVARGRARSLLDGHVLKVNEALGDDGRPSRRRPERAAAALPRSAVYQ